MGGNDGKIRQELFFALEAAVLLCGLLPFASGISGSEKAMLLLFIPFVLLTGIWMGRLCRRHGIRSAVIGGVLAAFIVLSVMLAFLGRTGFLTWEAVLAFVFVGRAGLWLEASQTAAERFRSFFVWECFAVPVLILFAARYTADSPLMVAAVVMYLLFRGFSLVYAQRLDGGAGVSGLRGALFTLGIAVALMVLLLVFPAAMLAFAAVGAVGFMVLDWLRLDITFTFRNPLPIVGGETGMPAPGTNDLQNMTESAPIPGVVWLGFGLVITALLLVAMYRYRSSKAPAPAPGNPAIRLVRMKEAAPRPLSYVPGATGIRQVYQALLRGMEEKGWPVRPGETPREYAARLEQAHPAVARERDALGELVRQYGAARYGVDPPPHGGAAEAGGPPAERASRLVVRLVGAVKPGGRGGKGQ